MGENIPDTLVMKRGWYLEREVLRTKKCETYVVFL